MGSGEAAPLSRRRADKGTPTERERRPAALHDRPDDTVSGDAIEWLIFLAKVDAGLAQLDAGSGICHDEVRRHVGL